MISDIHLGTYGCHAKELLHYLRSIEPDRVVLNGDIIDIWQFKKRYWPKAHMQVIKHILEWVSAGIQVDYITGNHDELLRKFVGFKMGSFQIRNKLLVELDGESTWLFHGDVFDITMKYSRWLCKLGAVGYDTLIALNRAINWLLMRMGKGRISLSKRIKNGVKSAVKYIDDFENTVASIGIDNGYSTVICGHIHQPIDRTYNKPKGSIRYLNSGDWIENCTALEYAQGSWSLYEYFSDTQITETDLKILDQEEASTQELYARMLAEFKMPVHSEQGINNGLDDLAKSA